MKTSWILRGWLISNYCIDNASLRFDQENISIACTILTMGNVGNFSYIFVFPEINSVQQDKAGVTQLRFLSDLQKTPGVSSFTPKLPRNEEIITNRCGSLHHHYHQSGNGVHRNLQMISWGNWISLAEALLKNGKVLLLIWNIKYQYKSMI